MYVWRREDSWWGSALSFPLVVSLGLLPSYLQEKPAPEFGPWIPVLPFVTRAIILFSFLLLWLKKKNTLPKSNFSEERVYWVYTSRSQVIIEGKDLERRSACSPVQHYLQPRTCFKVRKDSRNHRRYPLLSNSQISLYSAGFFDILQDLLPRWWHPQWACPSHQFPNNIKLILCMLSW